MKAGIPQEKTAWGLNQVCGSGLRAVALGMLHVASETPTSSLQAVRSRCHLHLMLPTCVQAPRWAM